MVPTLSLAYSVKAMGLNDLLLGHRRFVLPVRTASAERVVEIAVSLDEQREEVIAALESAVPRVVALAYEGGERLMAQFP